MTEHHFGAVDIDLLADYIGDALDDTQRARVARLIADDPEWRSAHAQLEPAMSQVGDELGALGAASEPMPVDLGVRLEAAFAADPGTASQVPPSRADRHLVSVPSGGGAGAARRRRRLRWAAPIAAAAGVIAFAGFGTAYLTGRSDDSAESTAAAGGAADSAAAPMMAPASGLVSAVTDEQIVASGQNYTAETLKTFTPPAAPAGGAAEGKSTDNRAKQGESVPDAARKFANTPPTLVRLREPTALLACLEAIAQQNAAGPITVQTVDYASYAGAAALVVRFAAAGTEWVWAAGPDCGAPGRDAQVRKAVRVG